MASCGTETRHERHGAYRLRARQPPSLSRVLPDLPARREVVLVRGRAFLETERPTTVRR